MSDVPAVVKSIVELPIPLLLCVIALAALGVAAMALYVILKVHEK